MKWLLLETFNSRTLSVIGTGSTPKSFVPLERIRTEGKRRAEIFRGIDEAKAVQDTVDLILSEQNRRVIAKPLVSYRGHIHGYQVWTGYLDEAPPERDLAGAWYFNTSTGLIGGSDDLLDLYGEPKRLRQHERTTAEAFGRLVPNGDEANALAMLVSKQPGTTHHATWTVIRDDGEHRAGQLSCQLIREDDGNHVVRGITHDIGPATIPRAPEPQPVLAQRVLTGIARPNEHRVLVDPVTLRLLRWLEGDQPLRGMAWTRDTGIDHPIHPDDLASLRRAIDNLAATNARLTLRVALDTTPTAWLEVEADLNLVLLDATTNAALLTLHDPRKWS